MRPSAAQLTSIALTTVLCTVITYWVLILSAPATMLAPARQSSEDAAPLNIDQMADLFGRSTQSPTAAPIHAPDVIVAGILASEGQGVALLQVDNQPVQAYTANQTLNAGATLSKVFPDGVEITYAGGVLRLPAPTRPSLDILTRGAEGQAPTSLLTPPPREANADTTPRN